MKKLLIALAAAATTAIGAYAEGWTTGTPFSLKSGTPGELGSALIQELTVDPTVAASASGFWTGLTNTVEVKAFGDGEYKPDKLLRFDDYEHLNYLTVKTAFGEPLFRNAQVGGTAYDFDVSGNGNIYFEGNVKFTACDETPEIASDAKIALYLKDLSDVDTNPAAETNLYVNIGGVEYNCGNNIIEVDDWTKLTIKMLNIDGAGKIGFVIYVNDVALTATGIALPEGLTNVAQSYADKNCLFPSATTDTTITGIGFAGQGALDQIAFTTENLVPDPSICEVTFGVGIDTLTITDSDGKTVALTADGWFEYDANKTYTYTYTAQSGYVPMTTPEEFNPAEGLDVPNADGAVAAIDDVMYATVAEAIADVNEGETVKLLEDAGAIAIAKDDVAFTLDLAGCNVTTEEDADAIALTAGTLTITNSVDGLGGVVSAGEGYAVYVEASEITIAGGKYDSVVDVSGATTALITGGKFMEIPEAEIAPGMQWTAEPDEAGYYTLEPIPEAEGWAKYLEAGENENEFLIQDAQDLLELATYMHTSEDFPTEGITFKQTADITLTEPFAGIGLQNGKDSVTTTDYDAAAFTGTYDGQNYSITGLQLTSKAKEIDHDYAGLFNSLYQATIKNVKVGISDCGWDAEAKTTDEWSGGVIAGVVKASTLENCVTLADGTFKSGKASAGIAGFVTGGSILKACTNNLNIISTQNEKAAGLIACVQNKVNDDGNVIVEDCANYGNVTGPSSKNRIAGLVSYTDNCCVTFKGDITCEGTLTGGGVYSVITPNSGTVAVDVGATITVPAAYKTVDNKAVDGLFFATVDNGVATLVKNAQVVADGTYKVMAANAPAITLANVGDSITLDTSLATATVNTTAKDAYVDQDGNVYTVTAKTTPEITITLEKTAAEWVTGLAFPTATVKIDGVLTQTGSWDAAAPAEPADAATTNTYTYTVTVAATDKTLEAKKTATFKVYKNAPVGPDRPSELNGTSEEIKGEYDNWATKYNVTGDTTAALVDKFILDLPATATAEEVQAELTAEITADMLAAAIASGKPDLTALEEKYPNATFQWVEATELTAVDGQSGFWKLTATLKMANGDK